MSNLFDDFERTMNEIITLGINPSIGTPSDLKDRTLHLLEKGNEYSLKTYGIEKLAFDDFLQRRYMDLDQFDMATNGLYMKNKDAIYQYMQAVYDYVYKDGKMPDWQDYIHPDYI